MDNNRDVYGLLNDIENNLNYFGFYKSRLNILVKRQPELITEEDIRYAYEIKEKLEDQEIIQELQKVIDLLEKYIILEIKEPGYD